MKYSIQKQLGQRIQQLRKIKGLSQEVLAEHIGIATNTLSSIETGNAFMTAQTLENILNILGVTASELFTFSENINDKDMYNYISNKLELIKSDKERLQILYKLVNALI